MKLTIVTIALNNLIGLKKTVNSVLSQSYKDFEYIIIDGGSTDGTVDYLLSLTFNGIKKSEPDEGIYNAMNKGINLSHGEYILFLNSCDTFVDSVVLSKVVPQLSGADIIYGDAIFWSGKKKREMHYPDKFTLYDFWKIYTPCHQATFIKTILLKENGGYDERYKIVADYRKWIELKMEGRSYRHLDVVVCNYMLDGISTVNLALHLKEHNAVVNELYSSDLRLAMRQMKMQEDYIEFLRAQFKHSITVVLGLIIMKLKDMIHHRGGYRQLPTGYVYDPKHPFRRPF